MARLVNAALINRLLLAGVLLLASQSDARTQESTPWTRHTIDNTSRGADGIRLADANGDGRLDLATGWEEGGVIRAYLQPEKSLVKLHWPSVTVGNVKSAEDAILVDLDGDAALDVVSCCEGGTKSIYFHFAPSNKADYLDAAKWQTKLLPASNDMTCWMFALPLDVDGKHGTDLVVSSKNPNAVVGWFESPANPRDVDSWKFHSLRAAGWIMSLIDRDMDSDGDLDVVVSDRKGNRSGVFWLENPGPGPKLTEPWTERNIGANNKEVMFIDALTSTANNHEVLAAVKPADVFAFERSRKAAANDRWKQTTYRLAPDQIGTAKSVRKADIDLDGNPDLVFSCEQATNSKHGVVWFTIPDGTGDVAIDSKGMNSISGPTGVKFDLLQLIDVDQDGDLDVLTCEERDNLGVVWYENPTRGK